MSETNHKHSFPRMTPELLELRLNEYLIEEQKYEDHWKQLKRKFEKWLFEIQHLKIGNVIGKLCPQNPIFKLRGINAAFFY